MTMSRTATLTFAALTALTLAACSPADESDSSQTEATTQNSKSAASGASESAVSSQAPSESTGEPAGASMLQGTGDLKLEDATIRAKAAADAEDGTDMTAIFGTIHNTSDREITIASFGTSLGDADYQIHETVDGTMREKEGGITIPAGGTDSLAPGGDHLMIMGYAPEIAAGDTLDVFFETEDGEGIIVQDVAVRSMLPGGEDYGEDGQLAGHDEGH